MGNVRNKKKKERKKEKNEENKKRKEIRDYRPGGADDASKSKHLLPVATTIAFFPIKIDSMRRRNG